MPMYLFTLILSATISCKRRPSLLAAPTRTTTTITVSNPTPTLLAARPAVTCSPSWIKLWNTPFRGTYLNFTTAVSLIVCFIFSLYDSEVSCDEADMSGFVAYQNDLCFSRPQSTSSFMYSYPDLHLFSGSSSCDGGVDTATALNATCTAYVGGLDDDDGSYYYYGHIQRSHTWTKQAAVAEDTSDVPSLARKFY